MLSSKFGVLYNMAAANMLTEMVLPNLRGAPWSSVVCLFVFILMCSVLLERIPKTYLIFLGIASFVWLLLDSHAIHMENRELKKDCDLSVAPVIAYLDKRLDRLEKTIVALVDAQRFREDLLYQAFDKNKPKKAKASRSYSNLML